MNSPASRTTEALSGQLKQLYANRFAANRQYRDRVWTILVRAFLAKWIPADATVLDLGSGYGEFINNVPAARRFALDLNPDSRDLVSPEVTFLLHDCATPWPLAANELDVVFSSNFLEHLPDKASLTAALREAWRCLRPGGRFIALGPNVRHIPGAYWDFFDHHIPLSDRSLAEALRISGFDVETRIDRFLPYTMVDSPQYPLFFLRLYLSLPLVWRLFGQQFLLVARKTGTSASQDNEKR